MGRVWARKGPEKARRTKSNCGERYVSIDEFHVQVEDVQREQVKYVG
jgi:hypothetical protein